MFSPRSYRHRSVALSLTYVISFFLATLRSRTNLCNLCSLLKKLYSLLFRVFISTPHSVLSSLRTSIASVVDVPATRNHTGLFYSLSKLLKSILDVFMCVPCSHCDMCFYSRSLEAKPTAVFAFALGSHSDLISSCLLSSLLDTTRTPILYIPVPTFNSPFTTILLHLFAYHLVRCFIFVLGLYSARKPSLIA